MKKFVIQVVFLIILITALFYFFRPGATSPGIPFLPQLQTEGEISIDGKVFKVEIADSQEKRSKGLSGRESLASGSGMLFVFEEPGKYPFWMKGVKIPLDFVYISGNQVVDIIQFIPPPEPGSKDETLPMFLPKTDIDKVLEVPAGTVRDANIFEGDSVTFSQ